MHYELVNCIQKTWVQVFFGAYMRLFYQQLCNIGRLSQGWRQKWRICKRNYCDSLTTRSKNLNTTKTINIHCMTHIDVPTGRVTEGASDTVSNVRVTVMLQKKNKPTLITAWRWMSWIQRFGKYVSRSCICSLRLLLFTPTYDARSRELKAAKAGHQSSHRQGDS
jgi:hypothetical protein